MLQSPILRVFRNWVACRPPDLQTFSLERTPNLLELPDGNLKSAFGFSIS